MAVLRFVPKAVTLQQSRFRFKGIVNLTYPFVSSVTKPIEPRDSWWARRAG